LLGLSEDRWRTQGEYARCGGSGTEKGSAADHHHQDLHDVQIEECFKRKCQAVGKC
jgi:hypothetical protein